ncbi:hypothetical protein FHW67_002478 [Herbaspirillum sp. Sphag1AN]|nr:hypothetical protein [Herbaspirillum sp. Sphag1AN]MBB3246386.1 hypothetical protein [Herbaspirillum sp. Sphag64]
MRSVRFCCMLLQIYLMFLVFLILISLLAFAQMRKILP